MWPEPRPPAMASPGFRPYHDSAPPPFFRRLHPGKFRVSGRFLSERVRISRHYSNTLTRNFLIGPHFRRSCNNLPFRDFPFPARDCPGHPGLRNAIASRKRPASRRLRELREPGEPGTLQRQVHRTRIANQRHRICPPKHKHVHPASKVVRWRVPVREANFRIPLRSYSSPGTP